MTREDIWWVSLAVLMLVGVCFFGWAAWEADRPRRDYNAQIERYKALPREQKIMEWNAARDAEEAVKRKAIARCEKLCAPHAFEYGAHGRFTEPCHCMTAVKP